MQLTRVIFCSLSWISPESAALWQWTSEISSWSNWKASWFHWPRTSRKLQFSQLPNQHGTTWAVTSTTQWADCFWECIMVAIYHDLSCTAYGKMVTIIKIYPDTSQYITTAIQSPPKESIHFCQAEYSKLMGARWKVGGAPNPPLNWSKLGQASFWNSKKWLHTNKNREETLFKKIAKFQNSHWLLCIWRKAGGLNLRNLSF